MNLINITPEELAGLLASAVRTAVQCALSRVAAEPAMAVTRPRSRKAVNQARYRQRQKERALLVAHESQEEAHGTSDLRGGDAQAKNPVSASPTTAVTAPATCGGTPAATPDTGLVSGLLTTCKVTSATTMTTMATPAATVVTPDATANEAPLPPAPSHPLPPQTPLSPAHPHPPTPAPLSRGGEVGLWAPITADAGNITEADHAKRQLQSQGQRLTSHPSGATCAVQGIDGPNDMSGNASTSGTATRAGGRTRASREERRRRRGRPERKRRERRPCDPEVKRLPRCEKALRLAAIFKRPATTEWSANETKELRRTGKIDEEDLVVLEKYYAAHYPPDTKHNHLRHDLVTLLQNLRGEVDRARRWNVKNLPPEEGGVKRDFFGKLMTPEYMEERRKIETMIFGKPLG